jgi:p-hydroxybenzoate 3-monooxygenase
VHQLAEALTAWYRKSSNELLEHYSRNCLDRVWRVQDFSSFMSLMLHRYSDDDGFRSRLQRAQLNYVCSSDAAARSLAENYVGLPHISK